MRSRLLLTAFALCTAVWGQGIVLCPDPAHTTVRFTLPSILHTVHGTFNYAGGDVHYDLATGKISGQIAVDAASGNSGDEARDRRMHRAILESRQYPEIVFKPDRLDGRVASDGVSQVQVHGMFTIHGAAHEITIPVEVRMAHGAPTVTARFSIPYVKWGMKNPSTLFLRVSDTVEIEAVAAALP